MILGIKNGIWSSELMTNKLLAQTYSECTHKNDLIILLFKLDQSKSFHGAAKMVSNVDFRNRSGGWKFEQISALSNQIAAWCGEFHIKFLYVKDIPEEEVSRLTGERSLISAPHGKELTFIQGCKVLKVFKTFASQSTLNDSLPVNK